MALYRRLDRQKMMINLMRIRRMPDADKRKYNPIYEDAAMITVGECQELLDNYDPLSVLRDAAQPALLPGLLPATEGMTAAPMIKMPEMPKLDKLPKLPSLGHSTLEGSTNDISWDQEHPTQDISSMMRKLHQDLIKSLAVPSLMNSSGSSRAAAENQNKAFTQKNKHNL